MEYGQEGDTRNFGTGGSRESRERLPQEKLPPTRCSICDEWLVGKYFRIDETHVACNRCNNERPGV